MFYPGGFLDCLAEKMPVETFEELRIPLSIVATDYWTGEDFEVKRFYRQLIAKADERFDHHLATRNRCNS